MIIVNTDGRMGNQMFQYAFAFAVAKKLSVQFFIDEPHYKFVVPRYFEMPSFHPLFNKVGRKLLKKANEHGWLHLQENHTSNDEAPEKSRLGIQDFSIYRGFFQSKKYFQEVEFALKRKEFVVKKNWKFEFSKATTGLYDAKVSGRIVAVHIRRTDYVGSWALPTSYYFKIIDELELASQDKLIFISDNPQYVKEIFGSKFNCSISTNSEIVDFQILQNADVLVLANSSFAWWAGLLKRKEEAIVIAPKNWLGIRNGNEYPSGVMTEDFVWRTVEFQNE